MTDPPRTKWKYRKQFVTLLCLTGFLALFTILANIPRTAEIFMSRYVTRYLTFLLNRVTNFLPFSLYELFAVLLILLCPTLVVLLVVWLCKKKYRLVGRLLYLAAVVGLSLGLGFQALYAPNYHREPVNRYLGVTEADVDEENLKEALRYYIEKLNAASGALARDVTGNVVPPLTFSELADALNDEYLKLDDDYFNDFTVRPKKVLLSVPMSYLGITGIYLPFTAEANINMESPSYDFPSLMAHEMAHAKGVARENEANFTAYYVCIRADDAYLNYSGLSNAVRNLLSALYPTDRDGYAALRDTIDPAVLQEWRNESEHYKKYDTFLDAISSFFNDLFLKSNGVPGGVASYGATTRSLVGLYESMK